MMKDNPLGDTASGEGCQMAREGSPLHDEIGMCSPIKERANNNL